MMPLSLRRCEICIAGAMGGPRMARTPPARIAGSRASIPVVPGSKPQKFEEDLQTSAHRINSEAHRFLAERDNATFFRRKWPASRTKESWSIPVSASAKTPRTTSRYWRGWSVSPIWACRCWLGCRTNARSANSPGATPRRRGCSPRSQRI